MSSTIRSIRFVSDNIIMSAADALKPPPGEVINYVNSPSIGYKVVSVSAATISLAILAVAIRLGVKFGVTKSPGWDDCKYSEDR